MFDGSSVLVKLHTLVDSETPLWNQQKSCLNASLPLLPIPLKNIVLYSPALRLFSIIRPLCRSPPDPGCDYLTPGHFLIGAPLIALPEEHVLSASSYCSRWQHLHQAFWKRWSIEYLKTLQVRSDCNWLAMKSGYTTIIQSVENRGIIENHGAMHQHRLQNQITMVWSFFYVFGRISTV